MWSIPLTFNVHKYSEMANAPKKRPIPWNQRKESATSKSPLLAVYAKTAISDHFVSLINCVLLRREHTVDSISFNGYVFNAP